MLAFAEAWPDSEFVQQAVAQIPRGRILLVIDAGSVDVRDFLMEVSFTASDVSDAL
jgi:hypothetical protein